MGNQPGSHSKGGVVIEETLESMQKEKQRDDHLKNLEFKRSKSIRRSIAKRLKGGKKRKDQKSKDQLDAPPSSGASEIGDTSNSLNSRLTSDVVSTQPAATNQPTPFSTPATVTAAAITSNSTSKKPPAKLFDKEEKKLTQNATSSTISNTKPKTERLYREDANRKPLVGDQPEPFPSHVQESFGSENGSKPRNMDRLRRSLRSSIRKKKNKDAWTDLPQNSTTGSGSKPSSEGGKPHQWQSDEISVRSGTCNFHVKYLGSVEVFDSRGMQVCEEAIKVLKGSKRKTVRSLLHVHGDGLKVVDDDTKGLIVDQTIEKVSFCAPDRNYERGFSYICRDGTTRRWMCHGFIAIKESGERLSHAVGCAFAICLERKQKRDKDCTVSMNFDSSSSSFTRLGSFRQATITERLQDPQVLKPSPKEPPVEKDKVVNPYAIARPHPTDLMLQRQTSFRGFGQLNQENSPFKRQLSLRLTELPSTVARQKSSLNILVPSHEATIPELAEIPLPPISPSFDTSTSQASSKSMGTNEFKSHLEELSSLIIENPSNESSMENQKLSSSSHSASIFVNAGLTHFEPTPRVSSAFSGISPRALATVPENETTTPVEEMSHPASLPHFPINGNNTTSMFVANNDIQPTFDPFLSLDQHAFQDPNPTKEQPTPIIAGVMFPSQEETESNVITSQPVHSKQSISVHAPDPLSNVKPVVYDNPWDLVPDQPNINIMSVAAVPKLDDGDELGAATLAISGKGNNYGNRNIAQQNISNCDSSSGISSSSATSLQKNINLFGSSVNGDMASNEQQHYHQLWQDDIPTQALHALDVCGEKNEKSEINFKNSSLVTGNNATKIQNGTNKSDHIVNGGHESYVSQNFNSDTTITQEPKKHEPVTFDIKPKGLWNNEVATVLDDPFDAEWAALATRESVSPANGIDKSHEMTVQSISSTNPFTNTPSQLQNSSSAVKTFEIQM